MNSIRSKTWSDFCPGGGSRGFVVTRRASRRRGAVLALAMVAFAAAVAILFVVLRGVVGDQQQVFVGRWQLQSESLARAGLDRAIAKLRRSHDYRGETWSVAAAELDGVNPASVQITVEPVPDRPGELQIAVQADFPGNSDHRSRQTLRSTVSLP